MSKICIVGSSNLKHISLISLYTKYMDAKEIPYDIIYIDRYGIDENTNAKNTYRFYANIKGGKINKLFYFWKFRRFVIEIIKKNQYDLVITWQTTTAYLLFGFLERRYMGKYIINVRDYICENKPIIRTLLKGLIKQAAMVTISSKGFLEFLPKANYVLVNSVNEEILTDICVTKTKITEPYKIGFVGNCRFFQESFKLIDALANDERFKLVYCGTNSEVLQNYADGKNIKNIYTTPSFSPHETLKIMSRLHMSNSAFGNDAWDNRTLMPIRLYTAVAMHLPTLANKETQLAKEIIRGQVGFVIDDYENLADSLYEYFKNLDAQKLAEACDRYLAEARQENSMFYDRLGQLIGVTK